MKKVFIMVHIECDCEKVIKFDDTVKNPMPIHQVNSFECECGRKFFAHVQEVRPKDEPHSNGRKT